MNLLNPDLLVLGGGALELPGYREAALETAERWSLPDSWRVCAVRLVRAGEAVAARRRASQYRPATTSGLGVAMLLDELMPRYEFRRRSRRPARQACSPRSPPLRFAGFDLCIDTGTI